MNNYDKNIGNPHKTRPRLYEQEKGDAGWPVQPHPELSKEHFCDGWRGIRGKELR